MKTDGQEESLKQIVDECQKACVKATMLYRSAFCDENTDVSAIFKEDIAIASILTPVEGLLRDSVIVAHGENDGCERYGKVCEYVSAAFTAILVGKFGPDLQQTIYRSYMELQTDFDAQAESGDDEEFKSRGQQYVLSHLEFSSMFVLDVFHRYVDSKTGDEKIKKELEEFYAQMADVFLPVMDVAAARLAGEIE